MSDEYSTSIFSSSPQMLIRRKGGDWRAPLVQRYQNERELQLLLRESPRLIARFLPGTVIVDELLIDGIGSLDLAAVQPDGKITLVECKLGSNSQIRREVVGQIFAYAAGLWQLSFEEFDESFASRSNYRSLIEAVKDALPVADREAWNAETFRAQVAQNLEVGRFSLIIAVDAITSELKKIVPYINAHTNGDVEFLALEVGRISDEELEIVTPMTYGQESIETKAQSLPAKRTWTIEDYKTELLEFSNDIQSAVNSVLTFSLAKGATVRPGTGLRPSINIDFNVGGSKRNVLSSYLQLNGPTIDFNFDYFRSACSSEQLAKAASILREIPGSEKWFSRLSEDFAARPSVSLSSVVLTLEFVNAIKRAIVTIIDPLELGL